MTNHIHTSKATWLNDFAKHFHRRSSKPNNSERKNKASNIGMANNHVQRNTIKNNLKHLPINKGVPFCSVDMFELKLNKFPDNQLPPMVKLNDTLLPSQHTFFSFRGVEEKNGENCPVLAQEGKMIKELDSWAHVRYITLGQATTPGTLRAISVWLTSFVAYGGWLPRKMGNWNC